MKTTTVIRPLACTLITLALLTVRPALGQQSPPAALQRQPSTLEASYEYLRTNGPPGNCGCINLNGGGVAFVHPLHGSSVSLIGRLAATHAGSIGLPGYDLTLFTYTAGARYMPRMKLAGFEPYAEIEAGGAHASGTLTTAPSLTGDGFSNGFAAQAGGGVNLNLHHRISFKLIDAAYLATTFKNGTTDHQNDLRLSSGLIFSLCSTKKCGTGR